jgi:pimeloyl-ACP methyl ester carboxylesterase
MRESWSIRAAALIALSLSLSWAMPARGESGKVYRYTTALMDGSGAGDELLFVSGNRVEVFSKQKALNNGRLLAYEMAGPGLEPKSLKLWQVSPDAREFIGTIDSLPAEKGVRVEIFPSGRPAETVATPVVPWALSDALTAFNLAFAAMKDPKASFTVGMVSPNFAPNETPIRFAGPVKVSYVADEERGGVPTRKYRLEGGDIKNGAFAWVHRDEKRIESLETEDGEEGPGLKLQFAGAQALDTKAWEEMKRAQFGAPEPTGPVAAVEVKPHPCRVPGSDEEVLCATYPVWENRETKQGKKIGLNIVILPALDKANKQPDPIFELGGGPGQGIAGLAGGYPEDLRQKRDIVLVDQRGTGRSNPLDCTFYGDPIDFRLAAADVFPVEGVRKCRAELEKVADLGQYSTAAFADDLNEVRQWLGYNKINLSGGSYGTRMAQVYWRRHPETVRSVLLIAVAPVDLYIPLGHAYAGQRALDLLLAECASQPECKAAFPDTKADLKAIKERVDKGVTVTVVNTRTGEKQQVRPDWGTVAEGIRFLMYGQGGGSLPLQIRKAAQGDLTPIIQMAIERRLDLDTALAMGLNFSITCAEDLPFITDEMTRKQTAGTLLGDYRVSQQKRVCENWVRGKVPADTHELVRSDVPVLIISGERDPVTPPEFGDQASKYMTNRLHVVVPRGSHGGAGECTDKLIREFIDRASVQGLDPACAAAHYGPTRFMMP